MELEDQIVDWLKRRVELAGREGAVFGMSGGLDSSVVGILCKRAFGSKALGLILPCESREQDVVDAMEIADRFDIETATVDLTPVFDMLVNLFPEGSRISYANLKPRLRMLTLYFFANERKSLVVGTGNKSEILMGYFTKYGDGGADILPLGDLYKSEVRELAGKIGVPEHIIQKPPSAGLWAGQTDEEEMGITYEALDTILESLESGVEPPEDKETVDMVEDRIKRQAHKSRTLPIFER